MSNLTLNTKTYTGAGLLNGVVSWIERSLGIASGFSAVRSSLRIDPESQKDGGKIRIKWDLELPVVATEDSSCSCAGEVLRKADVNITIRIDKGYTTAERTDFMERLEDLVQTTQFRASVISLEQQT